MYTLFKITNRDFLITNRDFSFYIPCKNIEGKRKIEINGKKKERNKDINK